MEEAGAGLFVRFDVIHFFLLGRRQVKPGFQPYVFCFGEMVKSVMCVSSLR
ncbi:TPA: hypothetical protein MB473_005183 [Klebsiella pneumoniae]|uniref:Uncharacterized protein n=1 Tax=Klebsiella pneumoniae subsp. pneumoniae (strain HS11286) TaxID=1125630 RepID=A0A0H3H589_KLEPH|nr:hypothetical protein [Klebsiella pneumoniae]YP_005220907.1 hypothetical protein [Klebsiella pneumoniae subsp. pneumoniae HS11286]HBV4015357.1 hypothetical protein [Klebsiella quasipneumoniae]AEW92008.1 hypothetical protein KPHS_p101000 [Klebsiella pneumoniae subsp. pneumoniae HS11286]ASC26365.1 hypothetical protein AM386_31670 [Klebsiella pneumoniae]NIA83296.1 hypothetical protein [Klebsiella pneumoniae]HBT4975689.1 hypothetical protein [Klebsiella pneumoniae]